MSKRQGSGIDSAPDSARGALANLRAGKRFYCIQCKDLRKVQAVSNDILQLPSAVVYETTLDCNHTRQIVLNVKRKVTINYRVPIDGPLRPMTPQDFV
jgi:hypothetical protein